MNESGVAPEAMAAPGLKELASSRDLGVGRLIVEFAAPGIDQILKATGCEYPRSTS